jgi:hypothetical protein
MTIATVSDPDFLTQWVPRRGVDDGRVRCLKHGVTFGELATPLLRSAFSRYRRIEPDEISRLNVSVVGEAFELWCTKREAEMANIPLDQVFVWDEASEERLKKLDRAPVCRTCFNEWIGELTQS